MDRMAAGLSLGIELAAELPFRVGAAAIDPQTREARFNDATERLQPQNLKVLIALAQRRGELVTREELIDRCWGKRFIGDDVINRVISVLRQFAERAGGFEIETVPRSGYRLVEKAAADTRGYRFRILSLTGTVLLLFAALAGLWWHLTARGERETPSIAVAAFTALNSDPDSKLYADSITAAVSEALVGTGGSVASADQPIATAEQARRAGAALLIRGIVRQQDGTISVTVNLDSARTGATLASMDFATALSDASSLPDHVAAAVGSNVALWITFARTDPDPEVSEQILRSWVLLSSDPLRSWSMAKDLAAAKPNSPAAQAGFASATAYWLDDISLDQREAMAAAARKAAARAALLDSAQAFLLPCLLTPPGRLILTPRCDAAVRRSLAMDGAPPWESGYVAEMLAESGRMWEAANVSKTSLAQSPYDAGHISMRMFVLEMEHPQDRQSELPPLRARAQRYAPEVLKDEFRYLANVANGNLNAAEVLLNDPASGDSVDTGVSKDIDNTILRAVRTRNSADVAAARRRCLPPPPNWNPPGTAYETCLVGLTMLGDRDSAFTLAQRGYGDIEGGSPIEREGAWIAGGGLYYPRYALWGSAMAPFRADRRFIDIARRGGLLTYWRSRHPPDFCSFERVPVCAIVLAK